MFKMFILFLIFVLFDQLNTFQFGSANHQLKKITPDTSKYIWPTNASYKISSSFAEFRSSHFHAGIDISTNKKEGYNIYSSRDGYVYRIKVMPDGYGKTLFVKHPDGFYTVYAHLKNFNKLIQEFLYREQLNRQSYFVDITLDSALIPVKTGEIIAFSGGTGVGPPHLHFEILDEYFNPVNPLLFPNLRINDNTAPHIKRIYIAPASEYSRVMGKDEYYFIKINSNKSSFQIQKPIIVSGQIKLGIETKDFNHDFTSKTGVYKIQLMLNDSVIFHSQYDRIPTNYTHEILLHYDLKLLQEGKGKFKKLYVEEGTNLPFYLHNSESNGIIDCLKLKNGSNKFKITVSDYYGNKAEITGNFQVNHQNQPTNSFANQTKTTQNNRNLFTKQIELNYSIFKNKLKCLLITDHERFNQLEVYLLEGEKKNLINFKNTEKDTFTGYVEPNPEHNGYREIIVLDKLNNKLIKSTGKFYIYPVKRGLQNKFNIGNGKIKIAYSKNVAYNDFILTIDSLNMNGQVIYVFNPKDILLKDGIDIEIRYNSKYEHIYFKRNGKWVFQKQDINKNDGYIKTRFKRTLMDVTLFADTTPPSIQLLSAKRFATGQKILFKFKDNLSGVDYDKIKMYINKEIVIPEIDEEKKTITYNLDKSSYKKPMKIELEIADRAGNLQKFTRQL